MGEEAVGFKMKLIEKKDNQIVFEAEIDESLANSIRRYLNHIPVLTIGEVEIFKNDSPLYDETIAHRIGLIPLENKGDKKEPKLKIESKKEGFVYSGELKGSVKPVYDNIPITYLNKGQEFEVEAVTKMGSGVKHSKFSPGLMFYRNVAEVIMDKEFQSKIKEMLPENEIKEKGNKIVILDNKKKEIEDICESISNEKGKNIEVELKDGLIITLESFGQLNVEDIMKKSIDEFKKDLNEIAKKVNK